MKPILFNTEMVRAILDGRKSVTRRVMKPQPKHYECNHGGIHEFAPDNFTGGEPTGFVCRKCGYGVCPPHSKYPAGEAFYRPYCWPGDILYVRETWAVSENLWNGMDTVIYRANYTDEGSTHIKWSPSIHMPKEAARVFLRVTDVRVERLHDITIRGFQAEGVKRLPGGCKCAWQTETCKDEPCRNRDGFEELQWLKPFLTMWDSTIKKADLPRYGWDADPWVWVIEFERISKEEAMKSGT